MNHVVLGLTTALVATAPVLAQSATPASSTMAPATTAPATPQVTVGETVSDTSGGRVGTISAVGGGTATVDTGTAKAAVPLGSFAQGSNGLLLGLTRAQLEAAVAQASQVRFAVGAKVVGPQGNPVGTVSAIADDLVTVQMANTRVQLPKKAFVQKDPATLAIGMTADQLEAAAKAAEAGAPGA